MNDPFRMSGCAIIALECAVDIPCYGAGCLAITPPQQFRQSLCDNSNQRNVQLELDDDTLPRTPDPGN